MHFSINFVVFQYFFDNHCNCDMLCDTFAPQLTYRNYICTSV